MADTKGSLIHATPLDADCVGDREGSIPEKRLGGPKTAAGKRRSSLNALRSGLYADAVLIKGEDRDEYLRFGRTIVSSLEIRNGLEQACAERVVSALWRSRRARRYEQAHLNRFVGEAEEKRSALDNAGQALANFERDSESVRHLGSGEPMTSAELNGAATVLSEIFWGSQMAAQDEDLPDRFWELFPECGRVSREGVAAIAATVLEIFEPVIVAETSDEFWRWVSEQVSYAKRKLERTRDEAAEEYAAALRKTFILDTTESDAYDRELRAGRVLEDAERRLERQISRALADLESAKRLCP